MAEVSIYCDTLTVHLDAGIDIIDITDRLSELLNISGIMNGSIQGCMVGSTGSLTTIECEPGVMQDLTRVINEIAPPEAYYAHEEAWHDGNGHSHVQAAILGPSISLAVRKGRLALGTWQQVVAINHDNRQRKRNIEVTIIGKK
jgi:secondary thiamine-phosphate synthase enzyme